ncbi:MAG TPA: FtsX-like permease family protein [bacterium]|uniref:Macrolide export ATP-binding/permease protein MacB n=1 Tax=candidate division TA06 bacterium ADurb.Bin417 TaxID=1852828 RepID=A0A1V5MFC1_UNCT6|nr:MAG: Macrolide export ATP-binding/permease protein MacB [candidate division TA06 bacterium ADurb.Bin417]HNQ34695.1 FtsX-like permease family protein [bacterium]HNS48068.1 FtsX-like permease family protein [bacterium]
MAGQVGKQVMLPKQEAFKMSLRNIRIRFGRACIVSSSVLLGVAFLMSIFTNTVIQQALLKNGPESIKVSLAAGASDSMARDIWLVSLSLLVCVVGITNAMLMSVTERSREIGTMKCLGALNRFIMEIFLIESGMQGLLGSLAGGLIGGLGMLITYLARYGTVILNYIPYLGLLKFYLFSIILGTVISIIGAVYPTYLSARMEPAEAIRREV